VDAETEAAIEAAAKAFLLGLFIGRSTIRVERAGDAWVIRLVPPAD
jgi:hypothetical protein